MRLCFVGPGYYPDRGGAEEYVRAMAERLVRKGHEVHVVVPAARAAEEERGGVRVHRLRARGFFSKRLVKLERLEALLDEINPELVHLQSHASLYALQAAEACGNLGKKYVVLTYGPTVEHNRGGLLRDLFAMALDWWTARKILSNAAAVLYRTENLLPWCRAHGAKKLVRAPTGFEDAFLELPASGRGNAGSQNTIGFVGGLSARKGCLHLVQALPKILEREPHAVLAFVGGEAEPGMGRRLAGEAERLGVSHALLFAGNVDASTPEGLKKLVRWFDAFDVFCLPSSWEGPSQALLQAMARGKPVVAARIPQLAGLVGEENGALVEFGDVKGLATALAGLLVDESRRARTGKLNREIAARFGFDRLARELEEAYRQALAPSPFT